MIRIAIVEDDQSCEEVLAEHLNRFSRETGSKIQIKWFSVAENFLNVYRRDCFDIVFMDIEMPMMNGIEASHILRKKDAFVSIVFVSRLHQFLGEGYAVEAIDFIIKPVSYQRLLPIMKRVSQRVEMHSQYILIHMANELRRVKLEDVYYLEVVRNHIHYHTREGEFVIWGSLKQIEKNFPVDQFCRCHSGYLVNLQHVKSIEGDIVTVAGDTLFISRSKRKQFMAAFAAYLAK